MPSSRAAPAHGSGAEVQAARNVHREEFRIRPGLALELHVSRVRIASSLERGEGFLHAGYKARVLDHGEARAPPLLISPGL